jgi:hypothetical protein
VSRFLGLLARRPPPKQFLVANLCRAPAEIDQAVRYAALLGPIIDLEP